MGSKVLPYFILTAEKVSDSKELAQIQHEHALRSLHQTPRDPPITPVPSGVSNPSDDTLQCPVRKPKKKRKQLLRYKIPVKEIRRRSSMNTRMELIKEKLERSRERFKQKKNSGLLKDDTGDVIPTVIGLNGVDEPPFTLNRSVSDLTGAKGKKKADGTFPYVYFVVSDDKMAADTDNNLKVEEGEKTADKSADKKRRVRIVEENKLKRDKKEQSAKMQGIARELGLKSVVDPKPSDGKPQTAVNHIMFPDTIPELPKSKYGNELPTKSHMNNHRHSPTRVPPGTPATYLSEKTFEHHSPDVDETVPRKPFLSGPLYSGKNRSLHSCSLQTFELPDITSEQKRRNLGHGSNTRFDEFAYPKPKSESRDRKVSFADQLPVIRGSGFVLSGHETEGKDNDVNPNQLPGLGPRAATMGSITLPSERVDKHSLCQRFLLNENVSSARTMRRNGVPLPLPKIDIVSNVYDEMIIKMIQEYLQVSNTPSRQSQLARELLVHLQKHQETVGGEITVPVPGSAQRESSALRSSHDALQLHKKARHAIFREMDLYPPPNTAEGDAKVPHTQMAPLEEEPKIVIPEVNESFVDGVENKADDVEESVPVVEVTIKNRSDSGENNAGGVVNGDSDNQLPRSAKSGRSLLRSREKAEMSPITPVSFTMAPPGLSKEEMSSSASLKT